MSLKEKVKLFSKKYVGIGKLTDSELMSLVEEGNDMAFALIYETHKSALYNFLLHTSRGDRELSSDIMQEAFLKLNTRASQFKEGSKVSSWLYTIAKNTLIDHYRKADALNHLAFTDDENPLDSVENLSFHIEGPEEMILKKVEKSQVDHCVGSLKESQRMAVSLRMHSELSYQEIAETMESTTASVKSLLNRAKNNLLNCLKGFLDE
jgi:RNA polymerase sigma-70 factor (ECF subfamily)